MDRELELEIIKTDGWCLQHIKEQTPEICMAAVRQNGYTLYYVKDKTPLFFR